MGQAGEIIEGEQVAVVGRNHQLALFARARTWAALRSIIWWLAKEDFGQKTPAPHLGRPTRGLWLSLTGALLSENERAIYRTGQPRFARASTVAESQASVLAGASTLACPNGEALEGSVRRLADADVLQEPTDHRKPPPTPVDRRLRLGLGQPWPK